MTSSEPTEPQPENTNPDGPTDDDIELAYIEDRLRSAGAVDNTGAWVPPRRPSAREAAAPKRKTLAQWQREYPYDTNPHPYVHIMKACPMGDDDKGNPLPPMNHSLQVLNMMAIHLARHHAEFPPEDERDIKYVQPKYGPRVIYNPGTWVDIDEEVEAEEIIPAEKISLAGVPQDQLDALKAAIQAEEIRNSMAQSADPNARDDALKQLAAEPTMSVNVEPIVMPTDPESTE